MFVLFYLACPSPPPPPPPLPEVEEDELSNTASHLQDRIGEYEDMELDDLDEPEPTSNDDFTSSTTFSEQQSSLPSIPPTSIQQGASISGLYDGVDESNESNIPSSTTQVGSSSFYFLLK